MRRSILVVFLVAAGCWADGGTPGALPEGGLDLRTAETLAQKNDPRLQPLLAALDAAAAEQRQLKSPSDPEARVDYRENRRVLEGVDTMGLPASVEEKWDEYEYGLRFFPRNPFVLRAELGAARARVRAAEAELRQAEWQIAVDVRRAYAGLQYLRGKLASADRLVELNAVRRQAVTQRQEQGAATSLEAAAVGLDHLQAVAGRNALMEELALAAEALALMTGLEDVPGLKLAEELKPPDSDPRDLDPARLQSIAALHRMELQRLSWQIQAAKLDLRAVRRQEFPWPSHVQVSYAEEDRETQDEVWGVQLALDLPVVSLFMGTREGIAASQIQQYETGLTEAEARVAREVRDAHRALVEAWTTREDFRKAAGDLVREMRDALAAAEAGADLSVDARAGAEEQMILAEHSLLEAEHVCYLAWVRLEEVIGCSLESVLTDPARALLSTSR